MADDMTSRETWLLIAGTFVIAIALVASGDERLLGVRPVLIVGVLLGVAGAAEWLRGRVRRRRAD